MASAWPKANEGSLAKDVLEENDDKKTGNI